VLPDNIPNVLLGVSSYLVEAPVVVEVLTDDSRFSIVEDHSCKGGVQALLIEQAVSGELNGHEKRLLLFRQKIADRAAIDDVFGNVVHVANAVWLLERF